MKLPSVLGEGRGVALLRPTFTGLRKERVAASSQFHAGRFRNPSGAGPGLSDAGGGPILREYLFSDDRRRRVPAAALPSVDPVPSWARPPDSGLRTAWLGHSTVLIEIDGLRVLTDPVWALRASPSRVLGPKRFQPVPVAIPELPELHAIVVSHDHYDHLDPAALLALARCFPEATIVTSLGVGARLEHWGLSSERIVELDWWERATIDGRDDGGRPRRIEITAAPSQHFSGRTPRDGNLTLWSAFAIAGPDHRVLFGGDGGLHDGFAEIGRRLGPFDLVALEVGAFHPAWGTIHLGPDNALLALDMLGGGCLLPVHWGTFNLALHAWDQPAERLLERAGERDLALLMPRLGQPAEPAHVDAADRTVPWWREVARAPAESESAHPVATGST